MGYLVRYIYLLGCVCLGLVLNFLNLPACGIAASDNDNGIKEEVLSSLLGKDIRLPHTKQIAADSNLENLISKQIVDAEGELSMLGHEITQVSDPHDDLNAALSRLSANAADGVISEEDALEIKDILLGTTEGRIYDGFALLNFNRWNESSIPSSAFPPDVIVGDYKTKVIRDTGLTEPDFDGEGDVNIWEVDVNMLLYGQQYDSDTFYIKVPFEVDGKEPGTNDTLRVNYHLYSLIKEDFAPTQMLFDANPQVEFGGSSVSLPDRCEDTVWVEINKDKVAHLTVHHSAFRFFRGIYHWGWRVHPPRIQFIDFLFEVMNTGTGEVGLNPLSTSRVFRNAALDINGIGDAAPEKKIYNVVIKALDGSITAKELFNELNDPDIGQKGIFTEWMYLMTNQIQLPQEARDILTTESKTVEDFDGVSVYLNNEMYGETAFHNIIRDWQIGDVIHTKIINLDNHTHYYQIVDFGKTLNDDIKSTQVNGVFSFEIANYKPIYGVPKVAEMQWRTGWGFKPEFSVFPQKDLFQPEDERSLKHYLAPVYSKDEQAVHYGYQYSEGNRGGDFVFNPPDTVIQNNDNPSFDTFYEYGKSLRMRYKIT